MSVTLIIPAQNEAQRIGQTLDRYRRYFGSRLHLFVVINGTTDQTEAVVRSMARRAAGSLDWVAIPERIGKGGAIVEGFRRTSGPIVGFVDADGATSPEEFDRLLQALPGVDAVIASRSLPGAVVRRTPLRRLTGWLFHLAVRGLLGLPFADTQCGAKIFRRSALKPILPQLNVRNLAFDVELLALLVRTGARIREVPTVWTEIPGPPAGWQRRLVRTGWEMFRTLLSLRRRLSRSR